MSSKVKVGCVACAGPCTKYRYRCQGCARAEAISFWHATGKDGVRSEQAKETARQRLADAETDLALGIDPERIAADQHCSRGALERLAWKLGRNDLAAIFREGRKSPQRRSGTCADCGGECRSESERCVDCHRRAVRGDAA